MSVPSNNEFISRRSIVSWRRMPSPFAGRSGRWPLIRDQRNVHRLDVLLTHDCVPGFHPAFGDHQLGCSDRHRARLRITSLHPGGSVDVGEVPRAALIRRNALPATRSPSKNALMRSIVCVARPGRVPTLVRTGRLTGEVGPVFTGSDWRLVGRPAFSTPARQLQILAVVIEGLLDILRGLKSCSNETSTTRSPHQRHSMSTASVRGAGCESHPPTWCHRSARYALPRHAPLHVAAIQRAARGRRNQMFDVETSSTSNWA